MTEEMNAVIYALQYGGDRDQAELRAIVKELKTAHDNAIAAAVQAEREACAQVAEEAKHQYPHGNDRRWKTSTEIADAIRARSEVQP